MKAKRTLVFVENTNILHNNSGKGRKFKSKYQCSECGKFKFTYSKNILCECQKKEPQGRKGWQKVEQKKNANREIGNANTKLIGELFWKEHITDLKELAKRTGFSTQTIRLAISKYYDVYLKP